MQSSHSGPIKAYTLTQLCKIQQYQFEAIEIENINLQLHVTGFDGADGKDQMVLLNSGEVKRVLMGWLAGPESPNP